MKISVIIPAYQASKFISEAIGSVLSQTLPAHEIIVVDDGSTDDTAGVVHHYPEVQYIHQFNQGTSAALNNGIEHATGDYFSFLDADDLWTPDKLMKQSGALRQYQTGMVFSLLESFLSDDITQVAREQIEFDDKVVKGIHKSAMMIRRDDFFKVGLFSPLAKIDLLDWYARSQEAGITEYIVPEVLVRRRIHGENQSLKRKEHRQEFPRIIKGILERRQRNEN